ncbi:MAG: NnrS family protein, partial [Pseudomonadota bacterium]
GLARFDLIPPQLALHAFTTGALGLLTLGMMARVALGHTGRDIAAGKSLTAAFALVVMASIVRVLGPLIVPSAYGAILNISGALWCLAFTLFVVLYLPVLVRPRVDGKPG